MRTWLKIVLFVFVCPIINLSWAGSDSLSLPKGWRLPTPQELEDIWRKSDPSKFSLVEGDFDGDKRQDTAKLLVEEKTRQFGIFVWWGKKKKEPIEVLRENEPDFIHAMGISLAKPGKQKTACGKGYFECKDEPAELNLKTDSIDYFKTESASSIFYWDKKKKAFVRVWISD